MNPAPVIMDHSFHPSEPKGYSTLGDAFQHVHLQWFAQEDEGKTEEPTEYKLKKAREEGRVAKSPDLVGAIGLLLTAVALAILAPWLLVTLRDMTRWFLSISIEVDPIADAGLRSEERRVGKKC